MKLLVYSHFFAPSVGGVETIVASLARGLCEGGDGADSFEVTLATNTAKREHDDSRYPFQVVRSPGLIRLFKLIRGCDLLHVAGPALSPIAIAWLLGKPRVIEHHSYQAICPNGVLLELPQRKVCPGHFQAGNYLCCVRCEHVDKPLSGSVFSVAMMLPRHWFSRKATTNIAITEHTLRRHNLPSSVVIHHGVPDAVPRTRAKAALAGRVKPDERFCFGFVGRFVPEKGLLVLLQAAELLKKEGLKFRVKLIGDGPERAAVESFIASRNLSDCVELTGTLEGGALEDGVEGAGALVMPSVWEEPAGLSAMEQMMRARLVIASAIGGLAEIVGDAGLLCPPDDPAALAERMRQAMQNEGLTVELGRKAQLRARTLFARQRMLREHVELYRKVVASGS